MNKGAKRTLRKLIIAVPLMFAFGFALVPLYDVFCEVTGINGKVFQSEHSEELVTEDTHDKDIKESATNEPEQERETGRRNFLKYNFTLSVPLQFISSIYLRTRF